jgi:putative hemolysin
MQGALTNTGVAAPWRNYCTTEGGGDEEEQHEDGKKPDKQEVTVG